MTKTFTSCFKTLASLLVALMCCWNITYAQVTSFPTTENFDGETICENEAFAPADNGDCPLIGTWSQDDGDDFDFSVETDATPSGSTGPSADHTGGGNFLFCETSGAGASSTFIIEGNDDGYDVSALSCPFVEVWYHAFGLSVVSGQVHLEASSDGGTTYTSIASVIGPDSEDTWKLLQGNLSSFAGATVHLRIRVFTGTSFDSDIGIDDVSVFDNPTPPTDLALSGLSSSAGCNASTSETITVSATNNSCSDIAAGDAEATIEVNGGGEITEALPAIPAGATVTYTFTATFDFSIPNTYTVDANVDFTAASGIVDDTPANNGVIGAALSISEFFGNIDANNPAYVESFEADNGGWVTVDVNGNTTMDLGTPPAGQTNINAASDGTMAWFSGGSATSPVTTGEFYNANELVFFQTGCFDMSCMETATFSIDVNWDSETNFDGLTIGFNTDGGTTFSILGIDDGADTGTSDGTGVNWYNSTIGAIGVPGWTGDCDDPADAQCSGGFVTATHDISFLAGASNVRFAVIFASDGSVQDGEGAAWDNVSITGDTTNPSCVGCTDANAANFSASAVYDDGNCLFPGCTDATACNFDSAANDDDGSCAFGTCGDGNCDTACGETAANCADCANTVLGCTDATACNFDVAANSDDGSCEFTSCVGCTDATACNFNSTATTDDGSCEFTSCVGCTNAAACNFNSTAT
ncbi:MAG: hypothetical protein ACPGVB_04660, partial [Chitinophagales bacterium]